MSKTPFDRNKAARTQRWRQDYVPLGGGLDENASPLTVKPGRLAQCLNFEQVFGKQGYRSVQGYERYDGRLRPSQAGYWILPYDTGTAAIAVGATVTNATTATGLVVENTIESGTVGAGTAAGFLLLTDVTDGWADNDAIKVGGVTKATASDVSHEGTAAEEENQTYLTAVREYLRGLIQAVPGEGTILGGAIYQGKVYAVRNDVGGLAATLWKSTATGWFSVESGIHADGAYRFEVANFTGDPTLLGLYCVNGRGRMFQINEDDTLSYMAIHVDSTATSNTNITIGTGAQVFTIVEAARSWQAGDALTIWRVSGTDDSMTGTVTSYVDPTLTMNITSVTGSGTHSSWEIGRSDFRDKPFLIRAHKNHMFLGYPFG